MLGPRFGPPLKCPLINISLLRLQRRLLCPAEIPRNKYGASKDLSVTYVRADRACERGGGGGGGGGETDSSD
jgi:hypothetical protein